MKTNHDELLCVLIINSKHHELWRVCLPVQDAHGGLPVFDEAHSAVVVPLVLDGQAADLNHHIPKLLRRATTLFRTRQLFAR